MIRSWSGEKIHGEIVDVSLVIEEAQTKKEIVVEKSEDESCHERQEVNQNETNLVSHSSSLSSHILLDEVYNDCCLSSSFSFDPSRTHFPNFDANVRHQNWLTQVQTIRKINQIECDKFKMLMARKTKLHKSRILKRAKNKGKGGYLTSTSATINSQVQQQKLSISKEESKKLNSGEAGNLCPEEKNEIRVKHKKRLKQYIQNLFNKRQMALAEAESMRVKENTRRQLLQDIVLSRGKDFDRLPKRGSNSLDIADSNDEMSLSDKACSYTLYPSQGSHTDDINEKKVQTENMQEMHKKSKNAMICNKLPSVNTDLTECHTIAAKSNTALNAFEVWKSKRSIPCHKKVFVMSGWYPSISQALVSSGWWVLNNQKDSNFFDFKFTLSSSEIDFNSLSSNQIVNHFKNSTCLTTKSGLITTLAKAPFLAIHNKNHLDFFPRAYNLSTCNDLNKFVIDALILKGQALLSCLILKRESKPVLVNVGVLNIVKTFLETNSKKCENMSFSEGEKISTGGQTTNLLNCLTIYYSEEWLFRIVGATDLDVHDEFLSLIMLLFCVKQDDCFMKKWKTMQSLILKTSNLKELDNVLRESVCHTLSMCHERTTIWQSYIDGGDRTQNLWILKPSGKSRGRDIELFFDLKALLKHIKPSLQASKPHSFIVQKYIETPLMIEGYKFDIRQWVLVTNWNPLSIWFYDDCYIRFAVEKYDQDTAALNSVEDKSHNYSTKEVDIRWVTNQFRHLVNNSIGKTSSKFHEPFTVELTGNVVNGYMWSLENFKEWLKIVTGEDRWESSLKTDIQNIVIDSILSAQEDIIPGSHRAFEIYGFDIMMDQRLKPWLIEINSSPACDYSTPVTESFVKRALPDVLKVVIPKDWVPNNHYTDTGGWKKIFEGPCIPKVPITFGLDMTLKGIPIQNCDKLFQISPGKGNAIPTKIKKTKQCHNKMGENDQNINHTNIHFAVIEHNNHIIQSNDLTNDHKQNHDKENIANAQTTKSQMSMKKRRKKANVPLKSVLLEVSLPPPNS